ncbi:MAG: hypothetical protein ACT4TC_13675 [Myxococcaceae bacterium]
MNRRVKDFAQVARLESAEMKLEAAKNLLMGAGEPMLSTQVSALLSRTRLELERARTALGLSPNEDLQSAG